MSALRESVDGFMQERELGGTDELAAAMRAETGESFNGDEVRYTLDYPQDADAVFLYAVAVTLKLDNEGISSMTRALRVDVETYLKTLSPRTKNL